MNQMGKVGWSNNITGMTDLQSSKTFKIRKTQRLQRTQEVQEQEEVANLKDLRLKDSENLDGRQQQEQTWGTLYWTQWRRA
jgi:protein tyrosine/serine phosphatase